MTTDDGTGERAVLAFLGTSTRPLDPRDEEEMRALARTAGLVPSRALHQVRSSPDPGTYFGRGKVEEIREALLQDEADLLLVGGQLTPAQEGRLEDMLQCRVLDRTELILDIFAQRARTAEGRLQVELAQLTFRLSRLRGLGKHLSRLGGGIGTRGPGETKLERDRQTITRRVHDIREELGSVRRHRETARRGRGYPQMVLLGYTNAGKTTLLGHLAEDVPPGEDRLFATLDPLTRLVRLPSGVRILISDTVGFVRDLPHALVAAFRATLEEVKEADGWIFVLDLASGDVERQEAAIRSVLREIGAEERPTLRLYNKADLQPGFRPPDGLAVSAVMGLGLPAVLDGLEDLLARDRVVGRWLIPFDRGDVIERVHRHGIIIEERHEPNGTLVVARVDPLLRAVLNGAGEALP